MYIDKILIEDNYKPFMEHQRRLNTNMNKVVKKELLRWLDACKIYPIFDSQWVSPTWMVPNEGGITVFPNEKNELIPQHIVIA